MTVHKTYIVDGKEYEASGYTEKRADGTIWKTRYSIYCEGSGRGGYIGEVHELHYRHGIGYRIVGWDSIVNVENQCTSLEEAVTALVLELDRRAARRKATQVSWGDVIVPRIEAWDTRDGKVRHVVYDTGHPDDMSVGEVTEIAPGKWKAELNLGYPWGGPPISICDTLSAAVQDIVDVIAKDLRPPYQTSDDAIVAHDDEEDEERPDDALTCPLLDTPIHFDDCKLCGGRGWVESGDTDAYLGPDRVPCVSCGGEGDEESGGPVTWTCSSCLGTGFMPTALLAQFDLTKYPINNQVWRNADLRDKSLRERPSNTATSRT